MKSVNFSVENQINNLISKPYYENLVLLRDLIEKGCGTYFGSLGAPKVDLYLISKSISSPIGLGSDSKPIEFHLGEKSYFLSDSSQFGMEPLLLNAFDIVYCYLPSFRGEQPDSRHLNQFYHCEAEMRGDYQKAISVAENLIKYLTQFVLKGSKQKNFHFDQMPSINNLEQIINDKFARITFDDAIKLLEDNGCHNLIKYEKFGRILTSEAENMITKLVSNNKLPVWVTNYDRDSVAFYQKPDPENKNKVLNADLLVPSLTKNGFGGEILGLGQRQNKADDIIESMERQNIQNPDSYRWYVDLRRDPKYQITSGFGMGIERYITWLLGLGSIEKACIYPVAKDSMDFF